MRCFVSVTVDASRDKRIYVFPKTKSNPTILFYNTIQIEDDPNASKAVPKQKSYFYQTEKKRSQTSCNDRSSMTKVIINMYDDPISRPAYINKNLRQGSTNTFWRDPKYSLNSRNPNNSLLCNFVENTL